jgi:hypothetical protein
LPWFIFEQKTAEKTAAVNLTRRRGVPPHETTQVYTTKSSRADSGAPKLETLVVN